MIKMLGNGRLEAYCFDGTNRLCHIRGKLRKKVCSFVNSINFVVCNGIKIFVTVLAAVDLM